MPSPASPTLSEVRRQSAPTLAVRQGGKQWLIRVDGLVTLVGSKSGNDIRIPSGDVSGAHLAVVNADGVVRVRDLMSRTGVWVNNSRAAPLRELADGDVVRVSAVRFRFSAAAAAATALAAGSPHPAGAAGGEGLLALVPRAATSRSGRAEVDPASAAWVRVQGWAEPVRVDGPPFVVGRRRGADLVLDDPAVSAAHALLVADGGRWFVRDLCSRTGTWVNGQRVKGATEVAPGDTVTVGQTRFRLEVGGHAHGLIEDEPADAAAADPASDRNLLPFAPGIDDLRRATVREAVEAEELAAVAAAADSAPPPPLASPPPLPEVVPPEVAPAEIAPAEIAPAEFTSPEAALPEIAPAEGVSAEVVPPEPAPLVADSVVAEGVDSDSAPAEAFDDLDALPAEDAPSAFVSRPVEDTTAVEEAASVDETLAREAAGEVPAEPARDDDLAQPVATPREEDVDASLVETPNVDAAVAPSPDAAAVDLRRDTSAPPEAFAQPETSAPRDVAELAAAPTEERTSPTAAAPPVSHGLGPVAYPIEIVVDPIRWTTFEYGFDVSAFLVGAVGPGGPAGLFGGTLLPADRSVEPVLLPTPEPAGPTGPSPVVALNGRLAAPVERATPDGKAGGKSGKRRRGRRAGRKGTRSGARAGAKASVDGPVVGGFRSGASTTRRDEKGSSWPVPRPNEPADPVALRRWGPLAAAAASEQALEHLVPASRRRRQTGTAGPGAVSGSADVVGAPNATSTSPGGRAPPPIDPRQRRRRLGLLAVLLVMALALAIAWATGVGRSLWR